MPVPTDITAGTLTITNGSTAVTGVGTSWLASDLRQGDVILWIEGGDGFQTPILADVPASNTALTLVEPWEGPTLTGVRYRIRYQWDSSRVSAQSRQLIELLDNGNILALAGLTGPGVPIFDGPHSMTVRPETDFTRGVEYDVQVDTLADRAAYDGQAAGFSVLVSDVGDGRSAVYSKASNTSGDWTDPAYVTGPVGPSPTITAEVTTTPPGSTAGVTVTPILGGYNLDFDLPAAEGFYNAGAYDSGDAYTTNQVVRFNGSSFIALQAVPAGTAPSSSSPPVDTAFWQVLVAKGADGLGTGDVSGPSSSANNDVAIFDGTTGKLIKSGGQLLTQSIATQAEAEAGTENTKRITALRARQAILAVAPRFDATQTLTRAQKGQILANIGAGWEMILAQTASSSTSLVWTDLSIYKTLWLICSLGPATSAPLAIRHSKDNGATFLSGASEYHRNANTITSVPSNVPVYSSDNYRYLNTIANCNAGEAAQSEVLMTDWNGGGRQGAHWTTIFYSAVDNSRIKTDGSGTTATGGPFNALQLSMPGSTFNGYGVLMGIRG